ncbi:MAG: hypothetical protein NT129_05945 [Candidatus Aenigmarchaeota archaeon]|nr:hypothetical protein [Candidatus Aenigmarchaeota archaeon]
MDWEKIRKEEDEILRTRGYVSRFPNVLDAQGSICREEARKTQERLRIEEERKKEVDAAKPEIKRYAKSFISLDENAIKSFESIAEGMIRTGSSISDLRDYADGIKFLLEQKWDLKFYMLNKILDFKNFSLICDSFSNLTFLYWFYKKELPAYSWSASDGKTMMRALRTGEYRKSYEADMNLIERTVRNIGERYG